MTGSETDIDRLVEMIAERVRSRLAPQSALPASERGPCLDDSGEDCSACGSCVVRRPWSVRSIELAGATRVGAPKGISNTGNVEAGMAKLIDHTILKPESTRDDIRKVCDEARKHKFASVCVNTSWVPMVSALLRGSGVKTCAVVGFPLGAMTPTAKAYEAREAVRQGADEIDMVINIGALRSGDFETVFEDICRVVKASGRALVKVILECSALDDDQKVIGCTLSKLAGADFVKTSTGFGKGGATVDDVTLMRRIVGSELGVKASGGVRTVEDVEKMALAGATRIGASASVSIVTGKKATSSGY
jgi:deoxyribose-phosphate aldolase